MPCTTVCDVHLWQGFNEVVLKVWQTRFWYFLGKVVKRQGIEKTGQFYKASHLPNNTAINKIKMDGVAWT